MILSQIGAWKITIIKHSPVQIKAVIEHFVHKSFEKCFTRKYFVQRTSLLKPILPEGQNYLPHTRKCQMRT